MSTFDTVARFTGNNAQLSLQFAIEEGNWWRRTHRAKKTIDGKFAHIQSLFLQMAELQRKEHNSDAAWLADAAAEAIGKARSYFPSENGPMLTHVRTTARVVYHGVVGNPRVPEGGLVIAEGCAYLSPEDNRDDEEGRQIALMRALAMLAPAAQGKTLAAYALRAGATPWRHTYDSPETLRLALRAAPFLIKGANPSAGTVEVILAARELQQHLVREFEKRTKAREAEAA